VLIDDLKKEYKEISMEQGDKISYLGMVLIDANYNFINDSLCY
jgi:hypothetical protein